MAYPRLPLQSIRPANPGHAWLEKKYTGFLHTIFMQGLHAGVYVASRIHPFAFRRGYSIQAPGELHWFWDLRDLEATRAILLSNVADGMGFFDAYYRTWEAANDELMRAYDEAEATNWHALSDEELYAAYERLYDANIQMSGSGYIADCFLTIGDVDWLEAFVSERTRSANAVETLTLPTIPTYTNEETLALSRLRGLRGVALNTALAEHQRKYHWIENNYYDRILPTEYFARKLELGIDDSGLRLEENRKRKEALLARLDDPYLARVVRMAELMTHIQDYRKMGLVRFSHYFMRIAVEMARRRDAEAEDVQQVAGPEMRDWFLNKTVPLELLRERREGNFIYGTPDGYLIYSGEDIPRYVDLSDFYTRIEDTDTLRGVAACHGVARGEVRIVRNAFSSPFQDGEILVTNNTTPEFVPLMKRAAAIVTEQGGITTHAAIVSRELKIPCVIGVRHATRVLKDGDVVEVDADNGIVRRVR